MIFKKLNGSSSGGSSGPAPQPIYNPASDAGYQSAAALLAQLQPQLTAAGTKMTTAQLMSALPAIQQQIIAAQAAGPGPAADMSSWGNINANKTGSGSPAINPVYAPTANSQIYNGPGASSAPVANYVAMMSALGTKGK